MSRAIADAGEVVPLLKIRDAPERAAPFAYPAVEVVEDRKVCVVVDPGPEPPSSLDQRDFDAGLGEAVGHDAATGAAANNADVKNTRCHGTSFSGGDAFYHTPAENPPGEEADGRSGALAFARAFNDAMIPSELQPAEAFDQSAGTWPTNFDPVEFARFA